MEWMSFSQQMHLHTVSCCITQMWEELPHSLRPQHAMAHGDSFHVTVRNVPATIFQPEPSSSGAASSSDRPQASDLNLASDPPTRNNRFMTPLHLYQLPSHEVITQLVNARLAQPSRDIANALNVPFQALEAIHVLRARPVDLSELTIAAVTCWRCSQKIHGSIAAFAGPHFAPPSK